eukprot:9211494-Pyramimonas_sp.AAC.1
MLGGSALADGPKATRYSVGVSALTLEGPSPHPNLTPSSLPSPPRFLTFFLRALLSIPFLILPAMTAFIDFEVWLTVLPRNGCRSSS